MPHKFTRTLTTLLLTVSIVLGSTQAAQAAYTPNEQEQIQHLQTKYAALDKTEYNANNIYLKQPVLKNKINAGRLVPAYIDSQLNYLNFYRSLFNLQPVSENSLTQKEAQKTAAVMAAIGANPFINQHGLPYEKRPAFISGGLWQLAKNTSAAANLHFISCQQTSASIINALLTDQYNLTGSDTGHRAWLLSPRLSSVGIGATYGSNNYCYYVQKVVNHADTYRPASAPLVTYPSSELFPLELLDGENIAWSVYLADKRINNCPKITITDKDSGKTYQATDINNYSSAGYGNFKTVITYSPGKTPLILGHEYQVNIAGISSYKFKLFSLKGN
ncbi:CAP domain-containing protein [Lactobacillus sp. ESL0791]|uniref:CAP domain-containing protein n=1 Tax=Lactobacillus sp. ESL0791 TaxID=2983234 RepID=UPI0023F87FB7|nr:CAP domain-containing protein [Lactobacillus sp. ESL0791]MDF7638148.1 CAP domain-containing protein [Lactobacillus sp. ESL0791]